LGGILKIVLMAVAAGFLIRWLRKLLGQGGQPASQKRATWPVTRQGESQARSKLKVLNFQTDPLEILGLQPGASDADIAEAYAQGMAENDPEKVAGMADEIRELAARRQREITHAYRQLCDEE